MYRCVNLDLCHSSPFEATSPDHQGDRIPARPHAAAEEGILTDVQEYEG